MLIGVLPAVGGDRLRRVTYARVVLFFPVSRRFLSGSRLGGWGLYSRPFVVGEFLGSFS